MATIHQVTLTPGKDDLVAAWIGDQRWYQAKGRTPRLRRLDSWRLDDPAGEVGEVRDPGRVGGGVDLGALSRVNQRLVGEGADAKQVSMYSH
mgnify:CR=1 FL=1